MFRLLLVGFIIISVNVILQAVVSINISEKLFSYLNNPKKNISNKKIILLLILTVFSFTLLHVVHALIWAISLYSIPFIQVEFVNFVQAFYFSLVTFTTLGYGDITLNTDWNLLSGFEAINGIMLIGWTTALMFSLLQHIFKRLDRK